MTDRPRRTAPSKKMFAFEITIRDVVELPGGLGVRTGDEVAVAVAAAAELKPELDDEIEPELACEEEHDPAGSGICTNINIKNCESVVKRKDKTIKSNVPVARATDAHSQCRL